jgi:spore maturation protein CgeB
MSPMRIVLFTHSLVSDWNHGNAHFLRGVLRELEARGHHTISLEPERGWSRRNLVENCGEAAIARFARDFPELRSRTYGADLDLDRALDGADLVIVHEWTDPALVSSIGRRRRQGGRFTLLFHDTHHRAVSRQAEIDGLDLDGYDGVLVFGEVLREIYLRRGWGTQVFTWHEAADHRLARPHPEIRRQADLVWIGNWGDDERTAELEEFLLEPVAALSLEANVHGVRYPGEAVTRLEAAGIAYRGWIANADVPLAFARHRVTIHVPRRPYVEALPGIPTIRMFEALGSGIPLVSAPWNDVEGLFRPDRDYLVARSGEEMRRHLRAVLTDPDLALDLIANGLETIRARHTCAHRVDDLLAIVGQLSPRTEPACASLETAP